MTRKPWYRKPAGEKKQRRTLDEMGYKDLVKKLDEAFSDYVRMGTAVKQGHPYLTCYTCGARHYWKEMDNGHFISRRFTGTRWHLSNTRPQCVSCNWHHAGRQFEFGQHLIEDGIDVKALHEIAAIHGQSRMPTEWLLAEIKEYRRLNKQIAEAMKGMEP